MIRLTFACFGLPVFVALFFTVEQVKIMAAGIGPGFAVSLLILGALAQITNEREYLRGQS